jgi:hypothetical protein
VIFDTLAGLCSISRKIKKKIDAAKKEANAARTDELLPLW